MQLLELRVVVDQPGWDEEEKAAAAGGRGGGSGGEVVVASKLRATEPGSFALLRSMRTVAWEGSEVEASAVAPEAAAALGEGRTAAPGGERAARLGRTEERGTASVPVHSRPRWDRGTPHTHTHTHPPPPRGARFTYPLAVFAREAVVLAGGSRPRRHREQHFSTAPCPEERKEREGEREEEEDGEGGGRKGEEGEERAGPVS